MCEGPVDGTRKICDAPGLFGGGKGDPGDCPLGYSCFGRGPYGKLFVSRKWVNQINECTDSATPRSPGEPRPYGGDYDTALAPGSTQSQNFLQIT